MTPLGFITAVQGLECILAKTYNKSIYMGTKLITLPIRNYFKRQMPPITS